MSDFYRTVMGQRFIDGTMPRIAAELERLNRNLEALVAAIRERAASPPPTET